MTIDNKLLKDKTVLISGAGENIGRSIAYEMGCQGAKIFFTNLDSNVCSSIVEYLRLSGIESTAFVSDITSTEDCNNVIDHFKSNNIAIDVFINNVGISTSGKGLEGIGIENWKKTFGTNVFGPIHLTSLVIDNMIMNKVEGNLIYISSIHSNSIKRIPSYSASKAAITMIIKELAYELSNHRIRVNGIEPGWVEVDSKGNPINFPKDILHSTSIEPKYIGRAAVYLASDYFSKYTTGSILKIDSGISIKNFKSENVR